MKRILQLGSVLLAVTALAAACGGGDEGLSVEQALKRMILQPEDLPQGFVLGEESFSSNEEAAAEDADRKALLDRWGRLLGYEVTYEPGAAAPDGSPVTGINVAANLYRTEKGARDAFADAVKTAEQTDWAANYAGLRKFKQEEIDAGGPADEIVWLRLSGFQPAADGPDALVTDDLIFFREGRERGFLRVQASAADTKDRGHYQSTVEGWLRALVRNVQDVLPQVQDEE